MSQVTKLSLKEYCEKNLNETSDNVVRCMKEIKEYLDENKNLNAKSDDHTLTRFLRASKYDTEKAKRKLNCYYRLRGEYEPWFKNRNPNLKEIDDLLKIGMYLPLKQRDDEGRCIIIIRPVKHNPKLHSLDNVFKVGLMVLDYLFDKYQDISAYGVRAIFDMEGLAIGHARQLNVQTIKRAVHSWQDCYPVRVKSLDWINTPSYINVVLNIFRSFMNEKIKRRVRVHGFDKTQLHQLFSKDILPEEYGGNNGKLEELIVYWHKEVQENAEWYFDDEKYAYKPAEN